MVLQFKIIFKPPSKIVKHFHFKDELPTKHCSENVDSFRCNSWNALYYGKKGHCYIRAADHMGILYSTPKRLKNFKQSPNSDHLLTRDYKTNFNDFTIVSKILIILIY